MLPNKAATNFIPKKKSLLFQSFLDSGTACLGLLPVMQSKCSQASFRGEMRCPEAVFSQQGGCPPQELLTWEGRCAGPCTRAPGRAGGEPGGQEVATGKWVC